MLRTRNQNARLQSTTIYISSTICASYVYALYRVSQDGLEVNDGLYQSFLKWKLKCENILDCRLAKLYGIDQYVSWCLPTDDLRLDIILSKYEEFCKPQANEVKARFDLLTSFHRVTDL